MTGVWTVNTFSIFVDLVYDIDSHDEIGTFNEKTEEINN